MNVKSLLIIAACLLCLAAVGHSQEIQYDTSAAKLKLGKELWKIQGTDGKLTMSLDGSKILVASNHNGHTFSVVDIEAGTARVLKGVEYYFGGSIFTTYTTDPEMRWLYGVTAYNRDTVQERRFLYDIEADRIIHNVVQSGLDHFPIVLALSKKYNLLLSSDGTLRNAQTYEVVDTLPVKYFYGQSFFDDAHGRIYWYSRGEKTVQEYDIASRAIREWYIPKAGINAVKIIRGPNSAWLYVATLNDGNTAGNAVYAFNTESNEKIEFTQHPGGAYAQQLVHMPEGTIWVTPTGVGVQGYSGNTMNTPRGQMAWELSAETRSTKIMANPGGFKFDGFITTKEFIITPDFSRAIHCWFGGGGDSSYLQCNELVPNITNVQETLRTTPVWFKQRGSSIEVGPIVGATMVRVEIATLDGRIVVQRPVDINEQRVIIPTQGLAVGNYVCTVRTTKEVLSTSFTILR